MKKSNQRERKLLRDHDTSFPEFTETQLDYLEATFKQKIYMKDSAKVVRWKTAQNDLIDTIIQTQLEFNASRAEMTKGNRGRMDD